MKESKNKKTHPTKTAETPSPSIASASDEQISTSDDKITELEADLKRIQADFVNYRRRQEDDRGQILDLAKQDVILQLLPLLDNIERALGHLPADLADNPWVKGVEQISRQADKILSTLNVERFASVGQPFDHNLHEAIAFDEASSNSKGIEVVVEELQPGYKIGEKIIRHAIVKVGRK